MIDRFMDYLEREHARLESLIQRELKQLRLDEVQIARLKKLKLLVKDRMHAFGQDDNFRVS